jgi:ribosomal protein S18 acetylase RimI-like enzyme
MIKVSKQIELHPIKLTDWEKLKALMNEIYLPIYDYLWSDSGKLYLSQIYSYENLKTELNVSDSLFYFVQYESKTIGILKLSKLLSKKTIHLQRIYLHPQCVGKGIGKSLFNWIENTFKFDFRLLTLEVMKSESKAVRFYEKMGMTFAQTSELNFKNIKPEFKQVLIYQKQIK